MPDYEERLRRLALLHRDFVESVLGMQLRNVEASELDPKVHALVRLGAVLAADVVAGQCNWAATQALLVGATPDEVVGTLVAVAPIIGLNRVVAAVPELALAIGYDIDAALEAFDEDQA
jgi:4-carboxymuconolactone decarboxylase